MREFAALQGMFVEFRTVPESPVTHRGVTGYQRGKTIYYGLRIPARGCVVNQPLAWVFEDDNWRGLQRRVPVPPALVELPAEISAVSIDQGSCGVYWQEAGEEVDIERIHGVLNALQEHFKN